MKFRHLLALTLLMLFSTICFSGNEVGNGGSVLINSTTKEPVIFYDHYETKVRYLYGIQLPLGKSEIEIALSFTERLNHLDKDLSIKLKSWIRSFYVESVLSKKDLPMIRDTGMIHIPFNMELAQLIIQTQNSKGVQYLINERYWKGLSDVDKGIAILHEVIYRKALELHPNLFSSVEIRYFVALIITDEIKHFSEAEYQQVMDRL